MYMKSILPFKDFKQVMNHNVQSSNPFVKMGAVVTKILIGIASIVEVAWRGTCITEFKGTRIDDVPELKMLIDVALDLHAAVTHCYRVPNDLLDSRDEMALVMRDAPRTVEELAEMQNPTVVCDVCGIATSQKCGRCKVAYFCSRECQAKAHPTHKIVCPILAGEEGAAKILMKAKENDCLLDFTYAIRVHTTEEEVRIGKMLTRLGNKSTKIGKELNAFIEERYNGIKEDQRYHNAIHLIVMAARYGLTPKGGEARIVFGAYVSGVSGSLSMCVQLIGMASFFGGYDGMYCRKARGLGSKEYDERVSVKEKAKERLRGVAE
jgi:hypothetical protein